MASWLFSQSPFDILVDKATSPSIPIGTQDIVTNLEIADQIRAKSVQPKVAVASLKKKIGDKNPNVQLLAFKLIDFCIKNSGDHFLVELAARDFIDNLVSVLRLQSTNPEVKKVGLDLFQQWALAFQSKPDLSYVYEVYKGIKEEGVSFPPPPASIPTALLSTSTAPTWVDSEVCLRCRTVFSFTNRKHHCRNCGKVFDQQCSSHSMALPWFGITEDVRVCDGCWSKSKTGGLAKQAMLLHDQQQSKAPKIPAKSAAPRGRAGREDEDLQKAIALSLAESKASTRTGFVSAEAHSGLSEPPLRGTDGRRLEGTDSSGQPGEGEEDDADLLAAIEASLREMRDAPSAPAGLPIDEDDVRVESKRGASVGPREWDLNPREEDAILTFSQTVGQASRMGERDLRRWGNERELWENARDMGDKVGKGIQVLGDREHTLGEMQTKLSSAVKLYDQLLTDQQAYAERQRYLHQASPYPYQPYGYPAQPQPPFPSQPGWAPAQPSWNPQQPSPYPAYNPYDPSLQPPQSPYGPPQPQAGYPQPQWNAWQHPSYSHPQQHPSHQEPPRQPQQQPYSPYPPINQQPSSSPYPQEPQPSAPISISTTEPSPSAYPPTPSTNAPEDYQPYPSQPSHSHPSAPLEEASAPAVEPERDVSNPWSQTPIPTSSAPPDPSQLYPHLPSSHAHAQPSSYPSSQQAPAFPAVPNQPFEPFPSVPMGDVQTHQEEGPEEGLLIAL